MVNSSKRRSIGKKKEKGRFTDHYVDFEFSLHHGSMESFSQLDTTVAILVERSKGAWTSKENVYLLCKKLCSRGIANSDGSDLFVVLISDEKKQIIIRSMDGNDCDQIFLHEDDIDNKLQSSNDLDLNVGQDNHNPKSSDSRMLLSIKLVVEIVECCGCN